MKIWIQWMIMLYVPISFLLGSVIAHFVMNKRKMLGQYLMAKTITQKEIYRGIFKNFGLIVLFFIILLIFTKIQVTFNVVWITIGTVILINMYLYWYLVMYIILLEGITVTKSRVYRLFYKLNSSEFKLYKQKEIENTKRDKENTKSQNLYNKYNKFN